MTSSSFRRTHFGRKAGTNPAQSIWRVYMRQTAKTRYPRAGCRPSLPIVLIVSACAVVEAASGVGVTVSTDADCVVAIDNKFVSRVHKGDTQFIPTESGRHTLSAATKSGDYFEESLDIPLEPSPSVTVSFEKLHAERLEAEKRVAELRKDVRRYQTEMERRRSIVEAANYYADRWGKELGLRDSRNDTSKNINDSIEDQYWRNLANPSQTAQGIGNMILLAEMWKANREKKKGEKNDLAAAAASVRMNYLAKAITDPVKYPPDSV